MENAELILSVVALLMVGSTFSFFLYLKYIRNQRNTTKKTVKSQTETFAAEQIREIQELYQNKIVILQETIKEQHTRIKSLQNAVNRYKGIEKNSQSDDDDEESAIEELSNDYEIDPKKALEYAQKFNLNVGALNNPALQNLIWEKIKENKDTALLLGIIRPKSGLAQPIAQGSEPAGSVEALFASLQAQGRFA